MNLIEYGRKTLPCGTIVYSYMFCTGGYLIYVRNIDTNKECGTAGVKVPYDYFLGIMDRLIESDITPDDSNTFIFNEVHHYFELHPPKAQKAHNNYLYL